MRQLPKNTLLQGGKYKIEKVLGQGGFGITYLATQKILIEGPIGQIETEIKLAIKEFFMKEVCNREEDSNVVSIPSVGSKQLAERFKQKFIKEAWNISKLKHPHIIKVVDVFEENETAYYVMEYHGNGSLNSYIKQNGAMPENEATKYILQIAGALDYVHKQQMNHLDIKPDNVLLNNKGEAVLIDFGLSKCYDAEGEQTSSTPIGVSIGYAPLEQSRVGGVGTFSPATDIYSLGATFYKLVTGQTPPDASEVLDEGLPDMPDSISKKVQNTITQAMESRRKKRPQSIGEFLALLDAETLVSTNVEEERVVAKSVAITSADTAIKEEVVESIIAMTDSEETVLVNPNIEKFIEINNLLQSLGVKDVNATVAVDLGLSVKWANCNIGSTCIGDKGGLYGWGDASGNILVEDYYLKDKEVPVNIAKTEFDIVTMNLGKDWSLPTIDDWKELIKTCKWEWISNSLIKGYIVTGLNEEKIFLPMAGRRYGKDVCFADKYGYYWSSERKVDDNQKAKFCFLHEGEIDIDGVYDYYVGRSIRGVKKNI